MEIKKVVSAKNQCLVMFLAVNLYSAVDGYASTVDLYQAFPDNQGDNGFYALSYNTGTGDYTNLTDNGAYSFYRPSEPRWGNPHIYKYSDPWIFISPSGTLSNPGAPEDGVLSYIISEQAKYQFYGQFYDIPGTANGINVYLKINENTIWSANIGGGEYASFATSLYLLNAGDVVCFGVNAINNTYFSEYNDWGLLQGVIESSPYQSTNPVPVPSTIFLLGSGIAVLVGAARKKE